MHPNDIDDILETALRAMLSSQSPGDVVHSLVMEWPDCAVTTLMFALVCAGDAITQNFTSTPQNANAMHLGQVALAHLVADTFQLTAEGHAAPTGVDLQNLWERGP
jgi:membrane protein required for beta-lactamase induction